MKYMQIIYELQYFYFCFEFQNSKKTNNLELGLKNTIKEKKSEIKTLSFELDQIKKNVKFCKNKEMEVYNFYLIFFSIKLIDRNKKFKK